MSEGTRVELYFFSSEKCGIKQSVTDRRFCKRRDRWFR